MVFVTIYEPRSPKKIIYNEARKIKQTCHSNIYFDVFIIQSHLDIFSIQRLKKNRLVILIKSIFYDGSSISQKILETSFQLH